MRAYDKRGQLAKQRAPNAEVKDFAQMTINDHTKANNELAQIERRMGVTLPKDVDPYHRAAMAARLPDPTWILFRYRLAPSLPGFPSRLTLLPLASLTGAQT